MMRWLVIFGLVLSGGVALANNNDDTTGTMGQQQEQQESTQVMVPTGAKLVGSTSATEVRTFPEMSKNKSTTPIVGARAVDRVYETSKPYKTTVGYFDKLVKNGDAERLQRTVTKTATAWSLKMPDGTIQNVVVRNTKPTTIETVKAVGAAGTIAPPSGMKEKEMNTPPGGGSQGTMNPPSMPENANPSNPNPSNPNPSNANPSNTNPSNPTPGGGGYNQ
jgi:hypothetical protein